MSMWTDKNPTKAGLYIFMSLPTKSISVYELYFENKSIFFRCSCNSVQSKTIKDFPYGVWKKIIFSDVPIKYIRKSIGD